MKLRLAADTVIWLDFNRYLRITRIFRRYLQYRGKNRPDMAVGCPERFNLEFLKYVGDFPRLQRPKVEAKLAKLNRYQQEKRIIMLQNPHQVLNLLQQTNSAGQ